MIKKEDIKVGIRIVLRYKNRPLTQEEKERGTFSGNDVFETVVRGSSNDWFHETRILHTEEPVVLNVVRKRGEYVFVSCCCGNFWTDLDFISESGTIMDEHSCVSANEKSDANRFKEITDKMIDTYKCKNHDYGNAFSEMYDELGINYGYGKIREKVKRFKTLKDNEAQVINEPLEDALLDCANYCILTLMEYQKRKEHGTD